MSAPGHLTPEIRSKRGKASRSRGQAFERWVRDFYEGYRTGSDQGGQHGDVQTVTLVIECKSHQKATPNWIADAWQQAQDAADATGKDPLTVHSWIVKGKREVYEVRRIA